MNDNKPKDKARKAKNNIENQGPPDMTSEELIESIRGKIQRALLEKAGNQNYSEK